MAPRAKKSTLTAAAEGKPRRKTLSPAAASHFDYEAVESKGRRKPPSRKLYAENVILPEAKRAKMAATAQDSLRNYTIVAWMVRRLLDYISAFRININADDGNLKTRLERLFRWHAAPRHFDIAGRVGREEAFRLFEQEKALSGDAAFLLLADGRIQCIESDLLARPKVGRLAEPGTYAPLDADEIRDVTDFGAVLDPACPGRVKAWCICNRGWDGQHKAFDHIEPAENLIFSGYITRFSSQIRGVSPLSSAINTAKDLAESMEWTRLKTKMHAIFGLALLRDDVAGATTPAEAATSFGEAAGLQPAAEKAPVDPNASVSSALQKLSPDSTLVLDMAPGDKVETIESKTPSTEFREFSELMVRSVLLAFDIPYSFYNSAASSYSSMQADVVAFNKACEWKIKKARHARKEYSDWLIARAWNNPNWRLESLAGKASLLEVQDMVEWIPAGTPWIQKYQEVQGDIRAIGAGLDNPIDICRRRGGDLADNLRKTARAYELARELGVPLMVGDSGQSSVQEHIEAAEEATKENQTKDEK